MKQRRHSENYLYFYKLFTWVLKKGLYMCTMYSITVDIISFLGVDIGSQLQILVYYAQEIFL
jgi:hypothetical protein